MSKDTPSSRSRPENTLSGRKTVGLIKSDNLMKVKRKKEPNREKNEKEKNN